MKTVGIELNLANLETQTLQFLAPNIQKLREQKSTLRDEFLTRTRSAKTGDQKKPHSGYATAVFLGQGSEESKQVAQKLRNRGLDTMLVLGIGGSSLGAKCVYEALKAHMPLGRLIFLENLDPINFDAAISSVDLKKTAIALISKAGGTIETLAQFSNLLTKLQSALGDKWKENLVCITDPQNGELRKWVNKEGLTSLSVPPEVGGRFSVFTPVGLLPLAFAGVDTDEFLKGAQDVFGGKAFALEKLEDLSLRLMDFYAQGADVHVIMPYATCLKPLGDWCVQLIGESLGKLAGSQKRVGVIPLAAVGATDQHSLLQLLMDGPPKFVTQFVKVKHWPKQVSSLVFAPLPDSFQSLSFAYNKPFHEILNLELKATQQALTNQGRANFEICLDELSPYCLGSLLAFYMDLVSFLGVCLNINTYDQPGVEAGKTILKQLS